jgi:RNA polymerase sigma-70 factor (ECF subfamily)
MADDSMDVQSLVGRSGIRAEPRAVAAARPESYVHSRPVNRRQGTAPMFTTPPSLLERIRTDPSQDAWQHFIDLYTPLFYSWARRLGLGEHDAADLIQDIFATLVEKLPAFSYDPRQSFRAWLKTILLNRWRNHCRHRAACPATTGAAALGDVAAPPEPPVFEEQEYRQALVGRALSLMQAEFQPATWRACWEFVVRERPAADVAAELGLSVNAVYLAKSRVLRRLREQLDGLLE